eukprot:135715-Chlamydomonas_euryale.AAC.2
MATQQQRRSAGAGTAANVPPAARLAATAATAVRRQLPDGSGAVRRAAHRLCAVGAERAAHVKAVIPAWATVAAQRGLGPRRRRQRWEHIERGVGDRREQAGAVGRHRHARDAVGAAPRAGRRRRHQPRCAATPVVAAARGGLLVCAQVPAGSQPERLIRDVRASQVPELDTCVA